MVGSVEYWYNNQGSIEAVQDSAVAAVGVVVVGGNVDHEEKTLFAWRQRTYGCFQLIRLW